MEMMNKLAWVKHELELYGMENDIDSKICAYDIDTILESMLSVYDDTQSNKTDILLRLRNNLPLTPLEDIPSEWTVIKIDSECTMYRNNRCRTVFKEEYSDHVEYFDINNLFTKYSKDSIPYYNPFVADYISNLIPRFKVSFPYYPPTERSIVDVEMYYTTDESGEKNYDLMQIYDVTLPDGNTIYVEVCFKASSDCLWQEITEDEYEELKSTRDKCD